MSTPNPAHGQITDLFSKSHASNEKFDYFICSVAGALFAYISQNFTPDKQPHSSSIALFIALACLSISFYSGCRRIQTQAAVVRSNQTIIEKEERIKKMRDKVTEYTPCEKAGKKVTIFDDLRENQYTLVEFTALLEKEMAVLHHIREIMSIDRGHYVRYGIVRDAALIIGFVAILISKILQI